MDANTTLDLLRLFFPNEPLLTTQNCFHEPKNLRNIPCSLDVMENDSSFVVLVDLPGMEKENIKVTYKNNFLTISGERKSAEVLISRERPEGSFERRLKMQNVRPGNDSISATYKDGVLRIVLMKSDQEMDRNIQIL